MNPKKKSRLQGNSDRLSDLPDSLILHILCLMKMKDAVKTGVLSKRWNLLWTEVDTINHTAHFVPHSTAKSATQIREQLESYISSVYNTLTRGISRIRNFSLSGGFRSFIFTHHGSISSLVDKWVEYALELKVETMNLDYEGCVYSCNPTSLFQSSSLTQLKIKRCLVGWPLQVNMTLLKSLTLDHITPQNPHLQDLLLGCPVLETLVLAGITWWNCDVRIKSPSLKFLKLVCIRYDGSRVAHILEVRAPLLQELEISGSFMVIQWVTCDFSSLVKANLMFTICQPTFVNAHGFRLRDFERTVMETKFSNDWIRMVEGLLQSVCHVSELLIGGDLLQVLTLSALLHKPLPTFMCKHVTVVSPLWKYDLPGIVYLLEAAPHLETISVNVSQTKIKSPLDQVKEALSVAHQQLGNYANAKFLHLKSVKIGYQQNLCADGCHTNSCGDFELVDYIMKSSVALERLVVCSPRTTCGNDTMCLKPYCAFQRINQLSCKLLTHTLPSNEDGEWELKKRKFSLEYTFSS